MKPGAGSDGSMMKTESRSFPIVFFDGVCGLCNHVVDWCMAHDPQARLRFAPLQGTTAESRLSQEDRENLATIVVIKNGVTFRRSQAVIEILKTLGGAWALLGALFAIVPRPLRDGIYAVIARVRYKLFGRKDVCRLPTPEERMRFLP